MNQETVNELLKLENIEKWLKENPDKKSVLMETAECPVALYLTEKTGMETYMFMSKVAIGQHRYSLPVKYYDAQEKITYFFDDYGLEYEDEDARLVMTNKQFLEICYEVLGDNNE